ncbi:amino acid-polyamine-organocation superfamily protein [Erythrobacter sp. NAP1]|uniref:APC family permease n=1 Tax=Erythrobacter sp. NAP1 TaxID=237727 RepID=UPI000068771F|nr:APC family permease [Erythrobacter sp. NAP1]EAQ28864.1 amino acid-polyamine-organocation superfamily protein [Erythrobacter sp. NAP1]
MKPPRVVGLGGAILTSLNGVVGSGIFALPALLFAAAGSFSPIAILLFACLYGSVLLVVAKLSTVFRQSGGAQLYTEHAFGPAVGFQVGWFSLATNMAGAAANFHVLVSYLSAIFPFFEDPLVRMVTMASLVVLFMAISISGTSRSIGAIALGTFLKLTPILVLVAVGFAQNGVPTEVSLPSFGEFESVALLLAFAFSGCDVAVYAAGEAKEPRKTLMRALMLNLGGVAIFYALVQLAYAATAPDPSAVDIPLAAMGEKLLGPTGSLMVSLAAIFSIATFQINVFFLVPRLAYGMARRGHLPHVLAYVSPRFKTPAVAIAAYAAMVGALTLSGTFELLAVLVVSVEQLGFLAVIGALVVMWKRGDAGLRQSMDLRWAVIIPVALGYIVWLMSQLEARSVLYMLIMVAIGIALYFLSKTSAVKQDGIDLPETREV